MFFFRRQYSLSYSINSSRCMDATSSCPAKDECSPLSPRFIFLSSQQDAGRSLKWPLFFRFTNQNSVWIYIFTLSCTCHLSCTSLHHSSDLPSLCVVRSSSYETLHYAAFDDFMLLHPSPKYVFSTLFTDIPTL
jgi:hypothetical protein